jgi:Tfp pilus assembly protein PilF
MKITAISILLVVFSHLAVAAEDMEAHARGAVELGWQYFGKGDSETALKRFNQARILKPDFAPSYFG